MLNPGYLARGQQTTDFKVKPGIDGFRFRGHSYRPGEFIKVSDDAALKVLRVSPLVEENKTTPAPEAAPVISPAVEAWTKKAKASRKK